MGREKNSVKSKKDPLNEYKKKKVKLLKDFCVIGIEPDYFDDCYTEFQIDIKARRLMR